MENFFRKITKDSKLISFVGGGGKTTTIYKIRDYLSNKKSLITSTTAMEIKENSVFTDDYNDNKLLFKDLNLLFKKNNKASLFKYRINKYKAKGCLKSFIDSIYDNDDFDYILCEADGAKRKPLKANLDYEPVIPLKSDVVLVMIGLDVLYKPLSESIVHRIDKFKEITSINDNDIINEDHLYSLIINKDGLLKGVKDYMDVYIILNKSDILTKVFNKDILKKIVSIPIVNGVAFTSMENMELIDFYEK